MKGTSVVREIMRESGVTQQEMSERMGYSHQSGLSGRLNSQRLGLDKLVEMLDVLGYELVARSKADKSAPEYVVTDGVEESE